MEQPPRISTWTNVSAQAPWHYRLARWLIRRGVRGPGLMIRAADSLGLLQHLVRYPLSEEVSIEVPLYRPENRWDQDDLLQYEAPLVDALTRMLAECGDEAWTLIDAGADIGLFSARVVSRSPKINRVLAIEPNRDACEVLDRNIEALPIPASCRLAAVADFDGRGRLEQPADAPSAHAGYVVPCEDGPFEVLRIDGLELPSGENLLLKLDVEGSEGAALHGARETLTAAHRAIVVVEAHPHVALRTGIDPIEPLRFLAGLRAFEFTVSERPDVRLDLKRPFFEQLGARMGAQLSTARNDQPALLAETMRPYNVVARSVDEHPARTP